MEQKDLLKKFEVFLSDDHNRQLLKAAQKQKPLIVDFEKLEEFDPELADFFLENPATCFDKIAGVISSIDTGVELEEKINFRVRGLPQSSLVKIKDVRSNHIGKFISIEGIIKQASEVRPEITAATFECQACGERITLFQSKQTLSTPYMCECGSKRSFELINRALTDVQRIIVEESPETLEGGQQPRKIAVYLRDDLVDPKFQNKVVPGNKVIINGVINDIPLKMDSGKETKRRDIYLEANYLEAIEIEFEDIELTKEDERQIKMLSKNQNVHQLLVQSIAPSIYGYEDIKEAIALMMFSGVRKERTDGLVSRGDTHILLVGDPGAGKSALLKYVSDLAPKGRYVVGKSTSGAGITAAAVKDEFTGGWALEAGALVLANKGLLCIDELDKMNPEDRSAIHEGLEQQTITVSKATIQATLQCKTIVLAAANPKFGRFDQNISIPDQIDLPSTLINRFDLIFPIRDIPQRDRDTHLAKHVLKLHRDPKVKKPVIDSEMLRKYIAYARMHYKPKLTAEAVREIENFYVNLRSQYQAAEGKVPSVPISPRQLEALVRLSEASARSRLSNRVKKEDAKRAIKLLTHCLEKVGINPETGMFDIDRLESGITSTQRNKIREIIKIITELQEDAGGSEVSIEDIIATAEEDGIDNAEEIIRRLKKEGEIFEPRQGFIRKV